MTGLPWFKCYPRDFREGMDGLTCEEAGAYTRALMLIYERGGPIPDDEAWLAAKLWLTVRVWRKIRAALIVKERLFALNYNGADCLMDERAADELGRVEGVSEARSAAGKRGGERSAKARSERAKFCPENECDFGNTENSDTKPNENNGDRQAIASGLLKQTPSKREADIQTIRTSSVVPSNEETTGGEPPCEPDAKAWSEAVVVLVAQGGMSEPGARSFFGKLLSQNGLQARDMLGPLAEAFAISTGDPQAYLTKAAQARARRRQATGPPKRVGFV